MQSGLARGRFVVTHRSARSLISLARRANSFSEPTLSKGRLEKAPPLAVPRDRRRHSASSAVMYGNAGGAASRRPDEEHHGAGRGCARRRGRHRPLRRPGRRSHGRSARWHPRYGHHARRQRLRQLHRLHRRGATRRRQRLCSPARATSPAATARTTKPRPLCSMASPVRSSRSATTSTAAPPSPPARSNTTPAEVVLAGAGDIARCDGQDDEATAALLDGIPGTVITLGDNVYGSSTVSPDFTCYARPWRRHKARTRPAVGHMEYWS